MLIEETETLYEQLNDANQTADRLADFLRAAYSDDADAGLSSDIEDLFEELGLEL